MDDSTPSLSNNEIVTFYLENGLIKRCVECQFAKMKDRQFEDDMFQDLVLILLEYDNGKMNDAHSHNHFNALITKILQNNIFSQTSPFHKKYYRQSNRETEITAKEYEIPDEI